MTELTHAGLYDLLHTYFGIGSHDEVIAERRETVPWYKHRMTEIGKLKRLMNSRHVDISTMIQAAEYAHDRRLPITAAWQVIEVIPDARRAAREAAQRPLSERITEAVNEALAAGEQDWALRLTSAWSLDALSAWETRND